MPVERQYGKRFAQDYDALYNEVDKVRDEARYHINTLLTQSESEIINLRKTVDDRIQDIAALHQNQIEQIEKAKIDVQFHMETEF